MPTDPAALARRARPAAARDGGRVRHDAAGRPAFVRRERAHAPWRRRGCWPPSPTDAPPVIVLSDEPTADPARAGAAGRVTPALGLTERQWDDAARGVERIARAVRDETGPAHGVPPSLRRPTSRRRRRSTRCMTADRSRRSSGCASTPAMPPTAAARRCDLLARHRARIWHVHFKDCEPARRRARPREQAWDYQTALRHGLFCELGRGSVDFAGLLRRAPGRRLTTAGSSSSRTSCRRWARRWPARRAIASICGRLGSECRHAE